MFPQEYGSLNLESQNGTEKPSHHLSNAKLVDASLHIGYIFRCVTPTVLKDQQRDYSKEDLLEELDKDGSRLSLIEDESSIEKQLVLFVHGHWLEVFSSDV